MKSSLVVLLVQLSVVNNPLRLSDNVNFTLAKHTEIKYLLWRIHTIGYKQNAVFVIIVYIRHGRYINNLAATAIRPW